MHFGYELLVGASRKSIIDVIMRKRGVATSADERLPGSLAVHIEAVNNGASIIRCHDVKEHVQAFEIFNEFRGFDVEDN